MRSALRPRRKRREEEPAFHRQAGFAGVTTVNATFGLKISRENGLLHFFNWVKDKTKELMSFILRSVFLSNAENQDSQSSWNQRSSLQAGNRSCVLGG